MRCHGLTEGGIDIGSQEYIILMPMYKNRHHRRLGGLGLLMRRYFLTSWCPPFSLALPIGSCNFSNSSRHNQFWGITEKLWIKVFDFFSSFLDIKLIHHVLDLGRRSGLRSDIVRRPSVRLQPSSMKYPWMDTLYITNFLIRIGAPPPYVDWPSASQHPLFYVGIYAAIGLLNALYTISWVAHPASSSSELDTVVW